MTRIITNVPGDIYVYENDYLMSQAYNMGYSRIPFLVLLIFLCVALAPTNAAVQSAGSSDSTTRIVFVNSMTGRSVGGAFISLREESGGKPGLSRRLAAGERLDLRHGVYDVQIQAPGYAAASARVTAGPSVRTIEINLDPIEPPRQLSPEYVRSLHRRNATVVVGCVVDEETRLPLAGVRILSVRDGRSVRTDRDGFFAVHVNVSGDSSFLRQPAAILFERDGYQAQLRNYLEIWPNGDLNYRIRLGAGTGVDVIDERMNRRRDGELEKTSPDTCTTCGSSGADSPASALPDMISYPSSPNRTTAVTTVIPSMIRVGRNCTGTSCTTVEYYSVETYCKHVVAAEVYACWGSLTGGMNSLQAFSVPVRSYGLWYVYHPISIYYDICTTTSCQAFNDVTSTNSDAAVNATAGYLLVDGNGAAVRSEYSAENNNAGCGDGYAGTGTSSPCIADPVCAGKATYGHGRGMCQWGSIRWATGTVVAKASDGGAGACVLGPSHGYGTKDWLQIVAHYYPNYQMAQAIMVSLYWAQFSPATAGPGNSIYVVDSVLSSGATSLLLGAAIAPTGTTSWAWDPMNDVSISLTSGKQIMARQYKVPSSTGGGSYDLQVILWYDDNGNYQIDPQGPTGDVLISSLIVPQALTVSGPAGVDQTDPSVPRDAYLAQNFPNPFNPETSIEYHVARSGHVKLTVHTLLGDVAAVLVNEHETAGMYKVVWNAASLTSGVYFVRMEAATNDGRPFTATRKVVLMK